MAPIFKNLSHQVLLNQKIQCSKIILLANLKLSSTATSGSTDSTNCRSAAFQRNYSTDSFGSSSFIRTHCCHPTKEDELLNSAPRCCISHNLAYLRIRQFCFGLKNTAFSQLVFNRFYKANLLNKKNHNTLGIRYFFPKFTFTIKTPNGRTTW